MRTKNAFKNISFAWLAQLVIAFFGFIGPKIIIENYGSQVNGLTATILQILSAVALIEAGAAGATIYALYSPLVSKNWTKVNEIVADLKAFYKKIGIIFGIISFVIAPVFSYYIVKTDLSRNEVLIAFILLSLTNCFEFFFGAIYRVTLSADQKMYVISITLILEKVLYYSLVILFILLEVHYLSIYVALVVTKIVKILVIRFSFRRIYGNSISFGSKNSVNKIRNREYVLFSEISHGLIATSPVIILSFLYNLSYVSVYSIYLAVYSMLNSVSSSVYNGIGASFGNLVASEGEKQVSLVFNRFQFIFYYFGAWLYSTALFLFLPFITLFTKYFKEIDYFNPLLAIMFIIYGVSNCSRVPFNILSSSYGIFKETYMQQIIFAVLSVLLSTIFGMISMPLILVGPIIFYLSITVYQKRVLNRKFDFIDTSNTYKRLTVMIFCILLSGIFYILILPNPINWFRWISIAFVFAIICAFVLLVFAYITERRVLNELVLVIKKLISNKEVQN